MNTIAKYLLSVYDLRRAGRRGGENAPAWENKSMWVFYIELATDFLKLTTYLIFFLIIIAFYGLPLNIVRDVYITARSFITRLRALHRYQTATRNMDQRYPNATEAELRAMNDRTCIICREEMIAREAGQTPVQEGPNVTPKKLPCGHVFHFHCLRSWLERQQSCPTCRRTVLENNQTPPGQMQGPDANPGLNNGAAAAENGANGQRNNVPGRNPFGFFGRFFAPPGQAPNGPLMPNNLGGLNLAGQMPQEVHIQYRIQYPHQQVAQPPEPLRPLPQFLGFARPGGAWQPWPAQLELNNQRRQNATPDVPAAQGAAPGTRAQDITNNAATQNPREAAALAALRRRTENSSGQTHVSNNASNSSTGTAHPPTGVTEDIERAALPQLIPLYNLNSTRLGDPRPDTWSNLRSSPPETQNRNISQLPPDPTEAQLALMDRLTREAIDERLRVLEGVSTAIHRCVDDLMRMRSVLPSPSRSGAHETAAAPTPEAGRSAMPDKTVVDPGSSITNKVSNPEPENDETGRDAGHSQQSLLEVDGTNE
ncbi:hypothetical protein AX14_002953 [Amanita brunnescens Koide BX004]|nr:hypothetical protein AX14_002953 [Amanita brunnescens Koide BX004]